MATKSNTEEFIAKGKFLHKNRYDYSKTIYAKSSLKVIITCKIHGDFLQTPNSHLNGGGCHKCAGRYITPLEFIDMAMKFHGSKYDYTKTCYVGMTKPITVTCKIHGDFKQKANDHLKFFGCHKCKRIQRSSTNLEFIRKAVNVHGNEYDYSKVNYVNNRIKIIIVCKNHGEFQQTPNQHLSGRGCRFCRQKNIKLDSEKFIEKCNRVHNNTYDYSKTNYINTRTHVTITCKIHGDFSQTAMSHLNGSGCSKCVCRISKKESCWLDYIGVCDDREHRQVRLIIRGRGYYVDGYDKETNTIYLFHGDFWHGNPKIYSSRKINIISKKTFGKLYKETNEIEELFKKDGYSVVTMWESDFEKIYREKIKKDKFN